MTKQNARSHPKKHWFAIISLFAVPLSGLSIDINVPSLPAVSNQFHVDQSLAQLTITLYMLGFGIFQLFSGSLSDSVGRKKPFIIAISVFTLASLLAPWTTNIYQLLILRFIQGVAIAHSSVAIRAVFSDLFAGQEFYNMATYMNIVWSLGPIIAPAIGGYLQEYFGWQAPFYFLSIYAIMLLILNITFLPETLDEKQPLKLTVILKNYRAMLTSKEYMTGLFCLGLLYSLMILFSVIGPFLIQNVLHYSAVQFGNMALLMGVAWFLGNMTNRLLVYVTPTLKICVCFWLMLAGMAVMTIITLIIPIHIYNIIVPTFYLLYVGGIAFPNYFAGSMALFPKIAASANALMGSFMILIASASSGLGALLKSNTQIPLTLTYDVLVVICLVIYYWGNRAKN